MKNLKRCSSNILGKSTPTTRGGKEVISPCCQPKGVKGLKYALLIEVAHYHHKRFTKNANKIVSSVSST